MDEEKKEEQQKASAGEEAKAETPAEQPAEETKAEAPAEQPAEEAKAEAPAEQPAEETKAEAPAEQPAEEAKAEAPAEQPAEEAKAEAPAEQPAEETKAEAPAEEAPKPAMQKPSLSIIIGIIVFIVVLVGSVKIGNQGLAEEMKEEAVLYTKDNALYLYDLENEPYKMDDKVADGGSYHYFYAAWGAGNAEEGDWIYYGKDISENGTFTLCRKNGADPAAKAEKIDTNVLDYAMSKDGEKAAYLKQNGEKTELHYFKDGKEERITDEIVVTEQCYALSSDGEHLAYTVQKGEQNSLYVLTAEDTVPKKLTDKLAMYAPAPETGELYYVAQNGEQYDIFSYDFKGKPAKIAENATYMEPLANGRGILYCVTGTEKIPYTKLIVDDMKEQDASMKQADAGKEQRDAIRKQMAAGEGVEPILQDVYILSDGHASKAAKNVISAKSVQGSRTFVTGHCAKEWEPVPLSTLEGDLKAVEYAYYMDLLYGEKSVYAADTAGHFDVLPGYAPDPESIVLSKKGNSISYLAADPETGGKVLMEMPVGHPEKAQEIVKNASAMTYFGRKDSLGYFCETSETGVGTLGIYDGKTKKTISEKACSPHFAEDGDTIYYLKDMNDKTGSGTLVSLTDGKETVIAENAYAFWYKGKGSLVYVSNYDMEKEKGDLSYYDGRDSEVLDKGVTAVFMY